MQNREKNDSMADEALPVSYKGVCALECLNRRDAKEGGSGRIQADQKPVVAGRNMHEKISVT